ncbi:hypothetical protein KCP76_00275 [Salmonella enterica subsp. enterica serovar Weltevreden]|nr:hypothetical protein KCP76_00275 [Salmonella enterica subsp. enterica serovar Weltevreden]
MKQHFRSRRHVRINNLKVAQCSGRCSSSHRKATGGVGSAPLNENCHAAH